MVWINDATSWGHVIVEYFTFAHAHKFKLQLGAMQDDGLTWLTPRTGTYPEVYLLDTLDNYISLAHDYFPSGTTFGLATVYKNQAGDLPAIPIANQMVGSPTIAPGGTRAAACFRQLNFAGSEPGTLAKFVFLDSWLGQPQSQLWADLDTAGQTFVNYLLGGFELVTREDTTLQALKTLNSNVNQKLVRKYGKYITP